MEYNGGSRLSLASTGLRIINDHIYCKQQGEFSREEGIDNWIII
jgi:hypothetical protein